MRDTYIPWEKRPKLNLQWLIAWPFIILGFGLWYLGALIAGSREGFNWRDLLAVPFVILGIPLFTIGILITWSFTLEDFF